MRLDNSRFHTCFCVRRSHVFRHVIDFQRQHSASLASGIEGILLLVRKMRAPLFGDAPGGERPSRGNRDSSSRHGSDSSGWLSGTATRNTALVSCAFLLMLAAMGRDGHRTRVELGAPRDGPKSDRGGGVGVRGEAGADVGGDQRRRGAPRGARDAQRGHGDGEGKRTPAPENLRHQAQGRGGWGRGDASGKRKVRDHRRCLRKGDARPAASIVPR